jgi:uncharacterized membrane protein YgcG
VVWGSDALIARSHKECCLGISSPRWGVDQCLVTQFARLMCPQYMYRIVLPEQNLSGLWLSGIPEESRSKTFPSISLQGHYWKELPGQETALFIFATVMTALLESILDSQDGCHYHPNSKQCNHPRCTGMVNEHDTTAIPSMPKFHLDINFSLGGGEGGDGGEGGGGDGGGGGRGLS